MSRRKGTRDRPRAEREGYRQQFTERPARAASPAAGEPISRRRRWGAAMAATFVLVVVFGSVVTGIVEEDAGNSGNARTAIVVAAGLVPVCFTVLAMVSRAPRPVLSVVMATPMAIAGFVGLGAILDDPSTALVAAFGIAGALVLRVDPGVHRVSLRISIVGLAAVATLVLGYVAPGGAWVLAPFLAFPASVVADIRSEARAEG